MEVRISPESVDLTMDGVSIEMKEEKVPRDWLTKFYDWFRKLVNRKQSESYTDAFQKRAVVQRFGIRWDDTEINVWFYNKGIAS
jgi:hypothetical protein